MAFAVLSILTVVVFSWKEEPLSVKKKCHFFHTQKWQVVTYVYLYIFKTIYCDSEKSTYLCFLTKEGLFSLNFIHLYFMKPLLIISLVSGSRGQFVSVKVP